MDIAQQVSWSEPGILGLTRGRKLPSTITPGPCALDYVYSCPRDRPSAEKSGLWRAPRSIGPPIRRPLGKTLQTCEPARRLRMASRGSARPACCSHLRQASGLLLQILQPASADTPRLSQRRTSSRSLRKPASVSRLFSRLGFPKGGTGSGIQISQQERGPQVILNRSYEQKMPGQLQPGKVWHAIAPCPPRPENGPSGARAGWTVWHAIAPRLSGQPRARCGPPGYAHTSRGPFEIRYQPLTG